MIAKWRLVVAGLIALTVCSCVVSGVGEQEGPTRSSEDFRIKYPDLSLTYYDEVVNAESLLAQGKGLYDRYYKLKNNKNKVDVSIRRRAVEILSHADEVIMRVFRDSGANSVLSLRSKIGTYRYDLLREGDPASVSPK